MKLICPNCGSENTSDSLYCLSCGSDLSDGQIVEEFDNSYTRKKYIIAGVGAALGVLLIIAAIFFYQHQNRPSYVSKEKDSPVEIDKDKYKETNKTDENKTQKKETVSTTPKKEATNPETPSTKPSSTPNDPSIENRVTNIRSRYNEIQGHLDYYKKNIVDGKSFYIDGNQRVVKIVAPAGTYSDDPVLKQYSMEFYFDKDEALIFAFAYKGSEEYRYYLKEYDTSTCIRHIDGKTIYNHKEGTYYTDLNSKLQKAIDKGNYEIYQYTVGA